MDTPSTCEHLQDIKVVAHPDGVRGCEDCLEIGGRWVHLRMCLTCGHVGCCDSSPNRHARQHWKASDHPIIQSLEPGETWAWCFVDETLFEQTHSPSA